MFTALLLFALTNPPRQRVSLPPATDWKIEITTTGGIAGIGTGGMTVSSDGMITITSISGENCAYQLKAEDLQSLKGALQNAQPAAWLECYSPADVHMHCCDLVRTTMTMSQGGGRDVFTTSWLTGIPPFPTDPRNLVDLFRGPGGIDARYRALFICSSNP